MPGKPTILFAQELGSGLGHITRLALVAKNLGDVHAIFVVRDPQAGRAHLAKVLSRDVTCLPAPVVRKNAARHHRPERSMADILAGLGFSNEDALAAVDTEWSNILSDVRPDLVISDFAPSLRIATAGRIAHIAVGNGFVMPPDVTPLPMLRHVETPTDACAVEASVLNVANRVRADKKREPFARLASLLQGDRSFGLSLPLLDPYRASRPVPLLNPLGGTDVGVGPAVTSRRGPHVFCYLDADSAVINSVLTALNGLDRPSHIFVRNIDPAELATHCAPQVGIHRNPADLRALLPQARLVVHSGTLGTAETALLAGTPQLLFPDTLERELTAQSLSDEGVGIAVEASTDIDPDALRKLIIKMTDDTALHARAVALAHRCRPVEPSFPAIIIAARHLLEHSRN